jgi:hypothetical protein
MPRSYCTTNDVKQYLPPNVVTEGDNPIPNLISDLYEIKPEIVQKAPKTTNKIPQTFMTSE